jgi:hypothetical protein
LTSKSNIVTLRIGCQLKSFMGKIQIAKANKVVGWPAQLFCRLVSPGRGSILVGHFLGTNTRKLDWRCPPERRDNAIVNNGGTVLINPGDRIGQSMISGLATAVATPASGNKWPHGYAQRLVRLGIGGGAALL